MSAKPLRFDESRGDRLDPPTATTKLVTAAPFHFQATVRVLQRRPANPVNNFEEGRYRRALEMPGGLVLAEVVNRGTIDKPDVRAIVRCGPSSPATRRATAGALSTMLGLGVDPEPLRVTASREPRLQTVAAGLRGMRPPRFANLFETIVNVVPFQQLSLDAGIAILGRLVRRYGSALAYDGRRYLAFPPASVIADARVQTLVRCGLSRSKAQSLRALARLVEDGDLTQRAIAALPTPAAISALTELPGIGPWSASVVLLRGFGRLDVFPPGDAGAKRGLRALLRVTSDAALARVVDRFGDLRGYLYFLALGASLLARGKIEAAPPPRV